MSASAWTPVDETAAKWSPVDETPPAPTASVSSGAPKGFLDSAQQWAENVGNDIKHGTDLTGIGTVLKKMGAHGVYSGNSQAVGDFMASMPIGLARIAQGAAEVPQPGKSLQGAKDIGGGALQAATIPASFVAPEAPEAVAAGAGKVAGLLPSAEKAGQLFGEIAKDANKVPVTLDHAGEAALRLMDWQKKTQLGPTINKFLNRITVGDKGPLTYEEARDFYQLLGKMSFDESSKLAGPVKYTLQQMTMGLKQDIGNAAETVGRGADYFKAMGDYAKAAKLREFYQSAKEWGINALKYGVPAAVGTGASGYVVKQALDASK